MRGIYVHAHAVSQILSAVEDRRPLIWWLPFWVDACFIWFWSIMGGLIVWRFSRPSQIIIITGIFLIFLYVVYWTIFLIGGWLPLIPSITALLVSSCSMGFLYFNHLKYR